MATLLTKADVKLYLDQITGTNYDAVLDDICVAVQAEIELYLGFTFATYTTATTAVAYGKGTPWLEVPPHQAGSITHVTAEPASGGTATDITGWTEQPDGSLYLQGYMTSYGGWYQGRRYTITANFGYGTTWPVAVKKVAVELAVNDFKARTTGMYEDVIGVEGSGGQTVVGYKGAFTKKQKMVLDLVKRQYRTSLVA